MYNFMHEVKAVAKKWGNSVGVVLPKSLGVVAGDELLLQVRPAKAYSRVRDLFGLLKGHKFDTQKLMREIDRDLDSEL